MSVNMSSLWQLITEITTNTDKIVDLVILGVVITIAAYIGMMVTNIIGDEKTQNQQQKNREFWQDRGLYK